MSNWIDRVRVGDKVRYLGGDKGNIDLGGDYLTIGETYTIESVVTNAGRAFISTDCGSSWGIDGKYPSDAECFELITDNTDVNTYDKVLDIAAKLATRVAKIEKEVETLNAEIALQNTSVNELSVDLGRITEDIIELDTRTQPLVKDGVTKFAEELVELIVSKTEQARKDGRI